MTFLGETARSSSTSNSTEIIAGLVLTRSVMVGVGESSECGLGLPRYVRIGVARTVFEHLDHAITGHIQVQQLAQVGDLLGLVTDVVTIEPDRYIVLVFDDHPATAALVGRAREGGT